MRSAPWLAAAAALALAGCAHTVPQEQTIQVQMQAEDGTPWLGALACEAFNDAGRWAFTAPGALTVKVSASPLQISCQAAPGLVLPPSRTAAEAIPRAERMHEGAATGAKVGAGAGAAIGVAAVPVLGAGIAVLMVAGAALRGAQIGELIGAVHVGEARRYPPVLVLRLQRAP